MNRLTRILSLTGVATVLLLGTSRVHAQARQGGGNFDPAEARQRMMERYREALEITADPEWKLVEERITKVTEARRDVGFGGRGFFGRGGAGGGRGGGNDGQNAQRGNRGGGGGGFGGTPMAEADDLQKALDAKASPEELKTKLAKYREARKSKQTTLAKAQEELRKVLSVRQEAVAVMMGLLE